MSQQPPIRRRPMSHADTKTKKISNLLQYFGGRVMGHRSLFAKNRKLSGRRESDSVFMNPNHAYYRYTTARDTTSILPDFLRKR